MREPSIFAVAISVFLMFAGAGVLVMAADWYKSRSRVFSLECGGVLISEQKGHPQYLNATGSYLFSGGSYKPNNGERCSVTYRESP